MAYWTICPERDVLTEIQAALRVLYRVIDSSMRLVVIKTKRNRTALPLMEQLNEDADRIAEEYLVLLYPQMPLVLMSRNTKAHLVFGDATVTSKYDEANKERIQTGTP